MRHKLIIIYDNWCPNCTRFMKLVERLDWFKLIIPKQLRGNLDNELYNNLDVDLALKQMASFNGRWHYGFDSIYLISLRLPLLWVLFPIVFIFKISRLGNIIYREIALKRKILPLHCDDSCGV